MPNYSLTKSLQLNGVTPPQAQVVVTDDLAFNEAVSVLAAQPGQLTTRTDATHGTLTMTSAGHGITTGQRIDLYWSNGQIYNVTVGTVAGTSVPITLTTGTLPTLNSLVTAGIPVQRTVTVTGNNLSALVVTGPAQGYFVFASSGPADLYAPLIAANGEVDWYTGSGVTNPLAGVSVASVWVSHSNIAGAQTMQVGLLYH